MMRFALIITLFLLQFTLVRGQGVYKDTKTGVTISFLTDNKMFPDAWMGGKVNADASSLSKDEYSRVDKVLKRAFSKYPLEVITGNLRKVYVLDRLKFYGVGYGGTYYKDAVYLLVASDDYLEQVFHAEFSSILLENYKSDFDEKLWEECNPDTFKYGGSGVDYIKNKKGGQNYIPEVNEMGFVNKYATSNLENDFNQFAKNTFNPKEGYWDLFDKYPRLRCKLDVMIAFYHKISPVFTEAYFLEIGSD